MKTFCQGGWLYGERGLRLPSAPWSAQEVASWVYGLCFPLAAPSGQQATRAVPLVLIDGHWVLVSTHRSAEWVRELHEGERKILICEVSERTPFPTVLEPLVCDDDRLAVLDPGVWSAEVACRISAEDLPYVLGLRVPMEILQ